MYINGITTKNRDPLFTGSSPTVESQQQALANRLGNGIESSNENENENENENNSTSILCEQYYQNELDKIWHDRNKDNTVYECSCLRCSQPEATEKRGYKQRKPKEAEL